MTAVPKPNEVTKLRDALAEKLDKANTILQDLHARAINAELESITALGELSMLEELAKAVIDSKRSDLERLVAAGVLANAVVRSARIVKALVDR